ncbi:TetR/AcrR family transcriptional regulator C-terminal domain-containing protein [Thermobaculum terrenum]|uniref:TetR/AcrR family transcriptional regulator C-terminal domain-containing protein n=1 Tax=Thermobaculum terrenum TaxID=166501 RepID=UPI0011D13247|nr:TetR/AcrR family transcriptional regulator C-terminal domain-containing protein [Thermobaculum terrenum]
MLPPDVVLHKLADAYGEFVSRPATIRLARLLLGEAPRHPQLFDPVVAGGPMRVIRFLKAYWTRSLDDLSPHSTLPYPVPIRLRLTAYKPTWGRQA